MDKQTHVEVEIFLLSQKTLNKSKFSTAELTFSIQLILFVLVSNHLKIYITKYFLHLRLSVLKFVGGIPSHLSVLSCS